MSAAPSRNVLVLAGGRSSERAVSLGSGENVRKQLLANGHTVRAVEISADGHWYDVAGFASGTNYGEDAPLQVTPGGGINGIDVVFPVLHGPYGEDGVTQGLLESLSIPYVGAGVAASAVCMDKLLFKDLMAQSGVAQVDYAAVESIDWQANAQSRERVLTRLEALGFPVFVKPARLGSSVGISRATDRGELSVAIETALAHDPRVIVEAASSGDEIECGVIGNREVEVSRPGKLEFDAEWYDFESKYEHGGMRLVAPATLEHDLEIRVCTLAAKCYQLAGCSGLARADFFVEGDKILVNELNTLPGFTETSVFPQLFVASGMDYGELLSRLLELAIDRFEHERTFKF